MQMGVEEGRGEERGPNMESLESMPINTDLVTDGSIDIRGRTADKTRTGGWKASPFIIVNEVAERMAFVAIIAGLVRYMVTEMHEGLPEAATHVMVWNGTSYILSILGAFLADAYLGRFKIIVICSGIYAVGMVLLTLSASLTGLRPPPHLPATTKQNALLYSALSLIALGTGGIKPCVSSFGADQFDESDEKEARKKSAFFSWFFFALNMGVALALTLMVYVQVSKGWGWGFGVPAMVNVFALLVLLIGTPMYRYQKPKGSPFTRFLQVIVAACRNYSKSGYFLFEVEKEKDIVGDRKLHHTNQYRFLDKAAVVTGHLDPTTTSRWRLCTVTQVEEFKCFIRLLPIWLSTIGFSISFAQLATFFISQAAIMNRDLAFNFDIPAGSMGIFTSINPLLLIPIYEAIVVPTLHKFTGHPRGITSLQRMGIGLFVATFAMASAALVENRRLKSDDPMSVSVFWLVPQFFLIGTAEVFTYVGALEFYYEEATAGTRSLSSSLFMTQLGLGNFISTALVKIVEAGTGGVENGWLRDNLNKSRLDYFYWILCGINAASFVVFVVIAMAYKGKDVSTGSVMAEKEDRITS